MPTVDDHYIVDIEGSGFGGRSYPIEVGVAMPDGGKYCSLVRPPTQWTHWDDSAEQVHHISRDTLHSHGRPVVEVAGELNERFAGETLYSDGWVVDKPWLITLFFAACIDMEFRVSPLEMILSEPQMAIWHETKDHISVNSDSPRHRASHDAWVIQETYKQTLDIVAS
ncbi:MAG: hypothetical protein ACI9BW_002755 [Gammaproteobacteria bacterium]|jgi:hypothetical protein